MGLFGGSTTTTASGSRQSTTNPVLTPDLQSLLSGLIGITGGLQKATPTTDQLVAQNTQQINQNADIASKAAGDIMAARGLSTSPVAATTQANIDANRIGQITTAEEQAPYQEQMLQLQSLAPLLSLASLYPKGSTTSGTYDSTQKTQSNPGLFSILGDLLGAGLGIGSLFKSTPSGGSQTV